MAADKKYDYGLGRRKSATARARLVKGKGTVTINDKPAAEYLSGNKSLLAEITDPLALAGKQKDFDVTVRVSGGGLAVRLTQLRWQLLRQSLLAHLIFVACLRRQNSFAAIHAKRNARSMVCVVHVSANNTQSANISLYTKYTVIQAVYFYGIIHIDKWRKPTSYQRRSACSTLPIGAVHGVRYLLH